MEVINVVIHEAWGKHVSHLMDAFDNVSKIAATGVIKTAFCF